MEFGPYLLLALLEGAVQAAVLALAASGLALTFGVMRVVNVAHGEFFMLGAVLCWWVVSLAGGSPAWAFAAALLIAPLVVGALAALLDLSVLARLKHQPESVIVATIGFLYIIQQTALMTYGPEARPVSPPFDAVIEFPWFGYSAYKLFVIAAAVLVLSALRGALTGTRAGLALRATRMDRETAEAFGIPVDRVYMATFALGAALAALAAVLITPIRQAHYLMGGDVLLLSFIVVILGGPGRLGGAVAAAVLIGLADGVVSMFFTPTLAKILATLLVALVLLLRPAGLFGGGTAR